MMAGSQGFQMDLIDLESLVTGYKVINSLKKKVKKELSNRNIN